MNHLVLTFALGLAAASVLAEVADERQVLALSEPQRGHVLEEMRALLAGVQNILVALSRDDMGEVVRQARPLGMGMARKSEDHLAGALPPQFRDLGLAVHQDFDQIAADAESMGDTRHTLRQLGETMGKCVVCHATYQVRTTSREGPPVAGAGHHAH